MGGCVPTEEIVEQIHIEEPEGVTPEVLATWNKLPNLTPEYVRKRTPAYAPLVLDNEWEYKAEEKNFNRYYGTADDQGRY